MSNHTTQCYNPMHTKILEWESTLLGMLICGHKNKQRHIITHIDRDMFTNNLNREIYDLCLEQFKLHGVERINPDNLITDYQGKKYKDAVFETLLKLEYEFITDVTCDYYIKNIHEAWINRKAESCSNLEALQELNKLKQKYELKHETNNLGYNSENLIADYFERLENPLKTYYPSIDAKIGSLQGGDLAVLAGSTGMGKTCMGLNLVSKMAKKGKKVLLFSLEMNSAQLQNRIIAIQTGLDVSKIRNFTFTDEELKKYDDYALSEEFKKLPIVVCNEYNINIERIKAIVGSSDCDLVVIDYLGLISGDNKLGSYEKVSEISRQLKLLALEVKKPFIVLHQLNRATKDRKDKRPLISDIRDSGKIEQDADFIFFVFRPYYYHPEANPKLLEFMIAKSRHTQSGVSVQLNYDGNTQRITEKQSWNYSLKGGNND